MQTFLDWFNHWAWLNPVLFVLALVAVGASYFFYRRSVREKKLTYGAVTHGIVAAVTSPKLAITYDGVPVSSLSESVVYIWNRGRQHIDKTDNQTVDPLRIVPSRDKIVLYDSTILRQSGAVNNFRIDHDHSRNQIMIDFDYIDRGQGVAISILHSGHRSQDIQLVGTVKGARESVKRFTMFKNEEVVFLPATLTRKLKPSGRYRLNSLMLTLAAIFFVGLTAVSFLKEISSGRVGPVIIVILVALVFGWLPIMHARRIPPSSIVDLG